MNRTNLSKSIRFEVFKRDAFTCQYCGRKAPDIVLEADHIDPVAKGGGNDILNLITACRDCNSGKSDRKLDDSSVIEKQRKQLIELQERKEQIEMMFQWQKGLLELDEHIIDQISEFWFSLIPPYRLTDNGKRTLKRNLKKHSIDEIMSAMRTAVDQYVEYENGEPTSSSVAKAWDYVSRICSVGKAEKEKPYLRDLFYIRGILRNRLSYVNERLTLQLLEEAYLLNASVDSLREHSKTAKNWTDWRYGMEEFINREKQQKMVTPHNEEKEDIEDKSVEEFLETEEVKTEDISEGVDTLEIEDREQSVADLVTASTTIELPSPFISWKPLQPTKKNKRTQNKQKRRN